MKPFPLRGVVGEHLKDAESPDAIDATAGPVLRRNRRGTRPRRFDFLVERKVAPTPCAGRGGKAVAGSSAAASAAGRRKTPGAKVVVCVAVPGSRRISQQRSRDPRPEKFDAELPLESGQRGRAVGVASQQGSAAVAGRRAVVGALRDRDVVDAEIRSRACRATRSAGSPTCRETRSRGLGGPPPSTRMLRRRARTTRQRDSSRLGSRTAFTAAPSAMPGAVLAGTGLLLAYGRIRAHDSVSRARNPLSNPTSRSALGSF